MLGNVKVLCSVTPLATRLSHSSAAFTEIHYRMTYSSSSCYGNIYKVTSSSTGMKDGFSTNLISKQFSYNISFYQTTGETSKQFDYIINQTNKVMCKYFQLKNI